MCVIPMCEWYPHEAIDDGQTKVDEGKGNMDFDVSDLVFDLCRYVGQRLSQMIGHLDDLFVKGQCVTCRRESNC